MSCCLPKHNVGFCPNDTCRKCTVPTYGFPDQANFGAAALEQCVSANGVLSSASDVMRHNEPFLLVTGTYYAFNGALFLHLATQERAGFTAHPIFPLSQVFYFRASKYPLLGVDVSAQGQVPYQSSGSVIREGDLLFLSSVASGFVLGQYKPPSPYSLPYFNTPASDAIDHFSKFGTQAGETMRIVSESFDPALPPNEQPPVRLDGSKSYFFQFTRTGQNLQVLPGASPAPCSVRTSEFRGDSTRLIPLAPATLYNVPSTAPVLVTPPTQGAILTPTERAAVEAARAAEQAAAAAEAAAASAEQAAQNNDGQAAANAAQAANEAAAFTNNVAATASANATNNSQTAVDAANAANNAARAANNAARAASITAANANSRSQ